MNDITTHRARERQLAWELLRNSRALRMLAMTAGGVPRELSRLLFDRSMKSDRAYLSRRSKRSVRQPAKRLGWRREAPT